MSRVCFMLGRNLQAMNLLTLYRLVLNLRALYHQAMNISFHHDCRHSILISMFTFIFANVPLLMLLSLLALNII